MLFDVINYRYIQTILTDGFLLLLLINQPLTAAKSTIDIWSLNN